ncbi:chymotrypsin-1-like [Nasonia vitripennis]|uniref:Peptidase S1 domain-containing protein n=1 Tax=Nasonia vitripennis TaxID=7425 RepID=A0A7M7HDE0_NASVI|nr:chymotrypsin-1-like [Nasonia vitripennis]
MKQFLILALCCRALEAKSSFVPAAKLVNIRSVPRLVRAQESPRLEAIAGEYPYQVSLQICGGSLISKRHVLTAAHCVFSFVGQKKDKNTIKVLVGTNSLTDGDTLMDVDRISHHGAFTNADVSPVMNNDIAVIRLKKEVTESATVKIISLPQPNQDIPENTQMILTGFGSTYTGGPISLKLRQLYMYATNRGVITVAHLCASLGTGYGACQVSDEFAKIESSEDLYTRVSYYLDYINYELSLIS